MSYILLLLEKKFRDISFLPPFAKSPETGWRDLDVLFFPPSFPFLSSEFEGWIGLSSSTFGRKRFFPALFFYCPFLGRGALTRTAYYLLSFPS